jgi:hypothetical protein
VCVSAHCSEHSSPAAPAIATVAAACCESSMLYVISPPGSAFAWSLS